LHARNADGAAAELRVPLLHSVILPVASALQLSRQFWRLDPEALAEIESGLMDGQLGDCQPQVELIAAMAALEALKCVLR
jgi:hypothetical protein